MYFSARHYSAEIRVYSERFGEIPAETLRKVAELGNAPALLEALVQANKSGQPIQDWTPYAKTPRVFSEAAPKAA
jgi:hypothetical protein